MKACHPCSQGLGIVFSILLAEKTTGDPKVKGTGSGEQVVTVANAVTGFVSSWQMAKAAKVLDSHDECEKLIADSLQLHKQTVNVASEGFKTKDHRVGAGGLASDVAKRR